MSESVHYWGVCDGCPSGRPQAVRDVDGATVCDFHALQEWRDPMDEPRHIEQD